jgi:hypothetical protein
MADIVPPFRSSTDTMTSHGRAVPAGGWSESDLAKLGYQNILRVLRANDVAYRGFVG